MHMDLMTLGAPNKNLQQFSPATMLDIIILVILESYGEFHDPLISVFLQFLLT